MSVTAARAARAPVGGVRPGWSPRPGSRPVRDLQRTFQLVLATLWLLDAVLQLQPFMFARGSSGFSGMLSGMAAGNPGWIARMITWNGSVVYHQPVLTDALFATVQFLIAFGIVWRRTLKPALALSIVWALGVWWFGEGLGGIFSGNATPFGGGPGGVLFYGVLAVLLWPSAGSDRPFVAARSLGATRAKAVWALTWGLLAILAVVGAGRSQKALHDLVAKVDSGQPGWLARLNHANESLMSHHGTAVAVGLSLVCVLVAVGVYLPDRITQMTIVAAMVVFATIWVSIEDFGGILAGGATDPNSGAPVLVLCMIYWPLPARHVTTSSAVPAAAVESGVTG